MKIVKQVSFVSEEEDIELPLSEVYTIKSIADWLSKISKGNQPSQQVDFYNIGLLTSGNQEIIFLIGRNTYFPSENRSIIANVFQSDHGFAALPKSYTAGLDRLALLNKLTADITAYTKTSAFHHSFLAKANHLILEANGQVIWKK